jgi:hypothetical protein
MQETKYIIRKQNYVVENAVQFISKRSGLQYTKQRITGITQATPHLFVWQQIQLLIMLCSEYDTGSKVQNLVTEGMHF